MKDKPSFQTAVEAALIANTDLLQLKLSQARYRAADALNAIRLGQHTLAIGIMLDLEKLLPEANALYAAIMLVHRNSEVGATEEQQFQHTNKEDNTQ